MKVFTRIKDLQSFLKSTRIKGKTIGLVPTMGALHKGHQALIEKCRAENDIVVCSIFVNPKQFNNPSDLKKYPRNLKGDLKLLENWKCHVVFAPPVKEMYKNGKTAVSLNFGDSEKILEGRFRPRHFQGVGIIVSKLLNIVAADTAYFGLKDLQQCFVIEKLVEELSYPVKLRFIKTAREKNGLAISSRNERLTSTQKEAAGRIYEALNEAKRTVIESHSIQRGINVASKIIANNKLLKLEYLEFISLESFKIIKSISGQKRIALCVAVFVGEVRLIDNLIFKVN